MPIYEYQCSECQHEFEALQKMSDSVLVNCPQCQQPTLIKKVSAAAFRLSGSGWYETDFKSGKKKNLVGDGDKSSNNSQSTDVKAQVKNGEKQNKKNTANSASAATSKTA